MLPLETPADTLAETPATTETRSGKEAGDESALTGRHLLIVDDNEINRRLFAAILQSAGMTWDAAGSGQAAVDMAAVNRYDLILMDLRMPGMDGVTATRLIRDAGQADDRVPILAVTADAGETEQDAAFGEDMDGVVAKPVKPETLLAKIAEILGCFPPAQALANAHKA